VAYGTIQEMSMIYLVMCWGDSTATLGSLMFCVTHSFLSAVLFYLVDCIQRRYRTRSIVQVNGLLATNPNLATAILFTCVVYMGLPGTTKFITEFYILSGLVEAAPYTIVLVVFAVNYIGSIGFCKAWFNVVFGLSTFKDLANQGDLSLKEILIIIFCFVNFFFFGQIINLLMY
jgi:NADH-quinone oxidoreductase subunit M